VLRVGVLARGEREPSLKFEMAAKLGDGEIKLTCGSTNTLGWLGYFQWVVYSLMRRHTYDFLVTWYRRNL
jgi:hypothetical protein